MSVEGVDIVTRVVDETADGVASTKSGLDSLTTTGANLNSEMSKVGRSMNALRGGAAVAGIAMLANEFAKAAEKAAELATQMRETNMSAEEITLGVAEAIPIFGQLVTSGRRFTEAIWEAVTGEEALAKMALHAAEQRERAWQVEKSIVDTMNSIAVISTARIDSLMLEVDLLEALHDAETGIHDTLRREHEERNQIAAAIARQTEEVKRMESELDRVLLDLGAIGGDVDIEANIRDAEEKIQALRMQHENEIAELRVRHFLEQTLRERLEREEAERQAQIDAERAAEQARRAAEQQAREQARLQQLAQRASERAAKELARQEEAARRDARDAAIAQFREQQSELSKMASIAGRLAPGTHAGRFETGVADTAREARIREVEREQRRVQEEQKRLLERIARAAEQQALPPQPVNI